MDTTRRAEQSSDLVALSERVRGMNLFRLVALGALYATVILAPGRMILDGSALVLASGYVAATAALGYAQLRSQRRGLPVFGALLLTDGLGIALAVLGTGGSTSPLRYLLILHVVVVALVVSYRSGVKIAVWDALALIAVEQAAAGGLLDASVRMGDDLVPFLVALLTSAFAASTASAINERELQRRRADLDALARLATKLERTQDESAIADRAVAAVADAFPVQRIALLGVRDTDVLLLAGHGLDDAEDRSSLASAGIVTDVVADRQRALIDRLDPDVDGWLDRLLPESRNLIILPLVADDRTVGVLVVEHGRRRGPRVEHRIVATLERFASHIALALDIAHLHRTLAGLATTDGLTGIANRRAFDEALAGELARAERLGTSSAVALFDLDGFKPINDTHGHLVGDEVLRIVATALQDAARNADVVARFGGDEFAVILVGADETEAARAAQRLRGAILSAPSPVAISATCGVAVVHGAGVPEPSAVLAVADRALYRAKAAGKNRVAIELCGTHLTRTSAPSPLRPHHPQSA